jgi:hypothetical protein
LENISRAPQLATGGYAIFVQNSDSVTGTGNSLLGTFASKVGQANSTNVAIDPL